MKDVKKESFVESIFQFLHCYLGLIEVSIKESGSLFLKRFLTISVFIFLVLSFFTGLQATLIFAFRLYWDLHWFYIFLIVDAEMLLIIIVTWLYRSSLERFVNKWFEK